MAEHSRGLRVQVYCGETEQVGHQPRYQAMVEYLRREGAAGATVVRGIAGFGTNSREIHSAGVLRLSLDLPVVLIWIDTPDRVERLLPGLKELAGSGIVSVDEVEIASYGARTVEHLRFDLPVREVMTRSPETVSSAALLRGAVDRMLASDLRALPVLDADGGLVGILTNQDLVTRGGLGARLELLSAMTEAGRAEILAALPERRVAEIMTPDPASVREDATLATAVHTMAERRIKRLPVVDAAGKLVGILSRWYVLRAVGETFPRDLGPNAAVGATTVADLMRAKAPVVSTTDSIDAVLNAVLSTRLNRAVVLDSQRRVIGVVSDADVIRAVDPGVRRGVIGALMGGGHEVRSDQKAMDFVSGPVAAVAPDTTIADAARIMIESRHKVLCVVDAERHLLGIVDRADLLRAAGDALVPPAAPPRAG